MYMFDILDPCQSKVETKDGRCCLFPFTLDGKTYTQCKRSANGKYDWCATKLPYSIKHWGYCAGGKYV